LADKLNLILKSVFRRSPQSLEIFAGAIPLFEMALEVIDKATKRFQFFPFQGS